MKHMGCRVVAAMLFSFFTGTVNIAVAQDDVDFWPNGDYDPAIPTVETVLGYATGERITWHRDAIRYFEALEAAAPDRVSVRRYASSWEGRDLIYVIVTSAANMARIDDVQAGMQRLADPRQTTRAEAEDIIRSQPAVTWLSYGVHGNEISSTDASMLTAYHLLASRDDTRVTDIMRDTVVVIDPMQNPDGRDRFVHHFEMAEGIEPDADRLSAEHDEPWPGGRTNHYLFDLNRDWFIMTQPESIGKVRVVQEWYPVVYVDAHEMGSDSTYFFAPDAVPFNPHLAEDQVTNQELYGRTNARWFDRFGIDYFTREVYDAFYPGYGSSWPTYFGAVAMTYEQASSRGLVVRQYDGNEMSYAYTIRNHFLTSLGTAETVAVNRQKFLEDFYDYRVTAVDEGERENIRAYIVPTQPDQAGADKLAGLLVQQGVEIGRATASFSACGEDYTAGSYVISTGQPAKRLIRTLMDQDVPMDDAFIAEQESRRDRNLSDQIYDVTAWSMPLMLNVSANACNRVPSVATTPAGPELVQPGSVTGTGTVGYLVPWGSASAVRFLANALRQGLAIKSNDQAFTHLGISYPSGTLIVDAADNPGDLAATVRQLAAQTGASVTGFADSWVTDGPNFGSRHVVRHTRPNVAIAWDLPTAAYVAGNTRFVIERQFGYPVTPIRTSRLAGADLRNYQVLILPSTGGGGDYADTLGERGVQNLKDWVDDGGVLIGIDSANRFLSDPEVDLLAIRREDAVREDDNESSGDDEEDESPSVPGRNIVDGDEFQQLIQPEKARPDSLSGILARADVQAEHWLGAGVADTLNVLVRGRDIYTPIRLDKGVNVARFRAADDLLASGYIWEENRQQLAYKPFVVIQPSGRGFVIGFTQDPNVRAYLDGLNVIFANAIFSAAAHARPVR